MILKSTKAKTEVRINYVISGEKSNLIVLVESNIKGKIFRKKIDVLTPHKKCGRRMIVLLCISEHIIGRTANQITAFAIVHGHDSTNYRYYFYHRFTSIG